MGEPDGEVSGEGGERVTASGLRAGDCLPGLLGDVARVAGRETAFRLALALGGASVDIPRHPKPHHALVQAIGLEAARKIVAEIGHGRVFVPLGPLSRSAGIEAQVQVLIGAGLGTAEIARRLQTNVRSVSRVKARLRERGRL